MLRIAILGCGQIGSRHFQSFTLLSESAEIHLVDTSQESLRIAHNRFSEVLSIKRKEDFCVHFHDRANSLPEELDVVVVASGAAHRAELCRSLLSHAHVKALILEKFLFQKEFDYGDIGALLTETVTPCWVNQWMSSLYAFRRLASKLEEGPYQMEVKGAGWGLCCNAVHFLEYFDFLSGRCNLQVETMNFHRGVIESKRSGYKELIGELSILGEDGSRLVLSCETGPPTNTIAVRIAAPRQSVQFDFGLDALDCLWGDGTRETYQIPMQSQLSHIFVENLMTGSDPGLPSYERSSYQHLLVLPTFLEVMRQADPSIGDTCPIT